MNRSGPEESADYICADDSDSAGCRAKAASELCVHWDDFSASLLDHVATHLKRLTMRGTSLLHKFHEACLGQLIDLTYEMVRDKVVSPAKMRSVRVR